MTDQLLSGLADRRRALLALAAVLLPVAARADGVPPANTETIQPAPMMPMMPMVPRRPWIPPVSVPATGGIDKSKSYYLYFEQNIDVASMKALRKQLTALVEAGVTDMTLVLSSAGGTVLPALLAYSFIRSLPASIDTHATGFVASAATVLFLAGQQRSADHNARFLFHPPQTALLGNVNEQQMHDQLTLLSDVEASVAEIYHERTKLSDDDIQRFQRETVTYTADQALRYAIVDTVGDLHLPGDQKARMLFIE